MQIGNHLCLWNKHGGILSHGLNDIQSPVNFYELPWIYMAFFIRYVCLSRNLAFEKAMKRLRRRHIFNFLSLIT